MRTFLGMQIFRKRKSDIEHVEEIRKNLARYEGSRKWLTILQVGLVLFLLAMVGSVVQQLLNVAQRFGGFPGAEPIWFIAGSFCGFFVHIVGYSVTQMIGETAELRTWRLLVHYYDACTKDTNESDDCGTESGGRIPYEDEDSPFTAG